MKAVLDYDVLVARAVSAFQEAHPPSSLPGWFEQAAFRDVTVDAHGRIEVRYYAQPAASLGPNETWIESEDGPVFTTVDAASGKISVIIHRDVPEMITLFRAVVCPSSGDVRVLEDRNIESIAAKEIEHPRR